MAEFRKLFYALAVVTLIAGLSAPAYAQPTVTVCNASAVPPIVRAEGYTELVGDLVLYCTGGNPTDEGDPVPQVNVTIFLTTNITSKLLGPALPDGRRFNEALLIFDEPNTADHPVPLLACGETGAPDTGNSGPGVCQIISTGDPSETYDGTPFGNPDFDSGLCDDEEDDEDLFGCGRPNVYQGRRGTQQAAGISNSVVWLGVPFDPPGSEWVRTIRITNVRADAEFTGVASTFATASITMQIAINGTTPVTIDDPTQTVAFVQRGLLPISVDGRFDFVQCIGEDDDPDDDGAITFREGFATAFKTRGWEQMEANGELIADELVYDFPDIAYPATRIRQNVPGAIYNTESGFVATPAPNWADPAGQNPPLGTGPEATPLANQTIDDNYGTDYGIESAGSATQGTRLALSFVNIAAGSSIFVPNVVFLTHRITGDITGVAVRTTTNANGAGAFSAFTGGASAIDSTLLAVYEILFANPNVEEDLTVPIDLRYSPNLAQNLPDPTVTTQVGGGFAPFYDPGPTPRAPQTTATLPVPRFIPGQPPVDLFRINKCACNLLFPFVTNASAGSSAFDTGIALANTSLDPGAAFGFTATAQRGPVQFWYYNTGGTPVQTQCTNTATPGQCPGTPNLVPAGAVLTYVLSQGSATWGLDNRGAGFTGYVIAQAQFQFCHAFAYISAQGAGPLTPGMSVGYLALVLDKDALEIAAGDLPRTTQRNTDSLEH